jgi:hypothetical protein
MKIKVIVVSLLAFLVFAASSSAFIYHLRYGQAKHASLSLARELCSEVSECTGYATGQCYRARESRFDCAIGLFSPGDEPGEEIECTTVLHWGVSHDGYVALKRRGPFHCFSV